ncbi:BZ3500_MvSof-1268-A1-R1_Chr8-2g10193 [Microbotryum saponariae]|uniref:BZ3500_MvSof-1268-A1-R1_Chr8-2g10193 protein n=1 Tax=Microbotryum saponariae TaxID=289078 RepID=A0A2X0KVL3_9BASI|nr:BZ3500_MvSof-1268-A1-R1_Chr8-2g10193 [Microbotryum saponariae]SDA01977.1 BZ3501_MvSof-1269-A2-R1_Chr8-2g09943 [Microbotryum saponariae]
MASTNFKTNGHQASAPPLSSAQAAAATVSARQHEAKRRRWQEQCRVVRLRGHATRDPSGAEDGQESIPAFEMLVVGCGGGPLETNLSSYLVKPYATKWADGCTSLEAGSTIGALASLIETQPYAFADFGLKIGVDLHEQASDTNYNLDSTTTPPSKRSRKEAKGKRAVGVGREGGGKAAGKIWDMVRCFAISHAHLDHIQGLIISSGASLSPRPVYGTSRTLANLDNVFDGGVWPRLVGWESDGKTAGRAYLYREIPRPNGEWSPLSPSLSFEAMPISHGMDPSFFHPPKNQPTTVSSGTDAASTSKAPAETECYDSTAFFVRESVTGQNYEFLFYGDVEPDSISKRPLNLAVCKVAAPRVVAGKLSTIFLECSYPTSQPTDKLWGHLSPPFMMEELLVLRDQVVQYRIEHEGWSKEKAQMQPLKGVTIVIIHIKDDILSFPSPDSSRSPSPHLDQSTGHSNFSGNSLSPFVPSAMSHHAPLSLSPPIPALPFHRHSIVGSMMPYSLTKPISALSLAGDGEGETSGTFSPPPKDDGLGSRRSSLPANLSGLTMSRKATIRAMVGETTAPPDPAYPIVTYGGQNAESTSAYDDGTSEMDSLCECDFIEEETVHERIERELNELEREAQTGVSFLRATQGMRLANLRESRSNPILKKPEK